MYQAYLSRYMDLNKCDHIRRHESCPNCGRELDFSHTYDSSRQKVVESAICQSCRRGEKRAHLLH